MVARPPVYAFANSLLVLGDDGVLVVDTQASSAAARALIAEIRRLTDVPGRWVVTTHWHGDHVYGNAAYREAFPGVEFVGHASQAEDVERAREQFAAERVAAVGDLLEHGFPFAGDGDPQGWAAALDSVAALGAEVLVPSHGPAQRAGRMLDDQRRLLAEAAARGCAGEAAPAPGDLREAFAERYGFSAAGFERGFAEMTARAREIAACREGGRRSAAPGGA